MPVNHSPIKPTLKGNANSTTVTQLSLYAYSNPGTPKRPRPNDDEDEPRAEEIPEIADSQNDTNMMQILKSIHSQMINLTKDVFSIKTQLNDHIQNCSSDNGTVLNEIKNQLNGHIQNCNPENVTVLNEAVKSLQNQLETVKNISHASSSQITKEQHESNKRKRREIQDWESNHFKRRDAFYASLRAEKEKDHLEGFITGEPIYIPQKYRPKPIVGETESRYKIREKRSISNIAAEIELRYDTITTKKEEYAAIDQEMENKIDLISSEEKKKELKDLWKQEVIAAENRGKEYWDNKKEHWWSNLKNKEPYEGFKSVMEVDEETNEDKRNDGTSTESTDRTELPVRRQSYSSHFSDTRNSRNHQNPRPKQNNPPESISKSTHSTVKNFHSERNQNWRGENLDQRLKGRNRTNSFRLNGRSRTNSFRQTNNESRFSRNRTHSFRMPSNASREKDNQHFLNQRTHWNHPK